MKFYPYPTLQTKLTANDAAVNDLFGTSVAMYGDYAIVGAYLKDPNGIFNAGAAYVFKLTDPVTNTWSMQTKLTADDAAAFDRFGISVAMHGDYAIVGANLDNPNSITDAGAAYVYKLTDPDTNTWSMQTKLTADDAAASDQFGASVAMHGDYAIIGSPAEDPNSIAEAGAAYIFKLTDPVTNTWSMQTKLTADDAAISDFFGNTVNIHGDYAIVGAYQEDPNGISNAGAAYVFKLTDSNTNTWSMQTKLTAFDAQANDWASVSVDVYGDYAIMGAYIEDPSGINNAGAAYVFKLTDSNTNTWSMETKLTAFDAQADDLFGSAASIYENYAVVGAYGANPNSIADAGAAYIFRLTDPDTNTWSFQTKLTADDAAASDLFGQGSIGMHEQYVIAGASGKNSNTGAAYVTKNAIPPSVDIDITISPFATGYCGVTPFTFALTLTSQDISESSFDGATITLYRGPSDDPGNTLLTSVFLEEYVQDYPITQAVAFGASRSFSAVADLFSSTVSFLCSVKIFELSYLETSLSGDNIVQNPVVNYTYTITPSSNIALSVSGLEVPSGKLAPNFVARVQTQTGQITSFFTPNTLYFPVTEFGIHTISISGIPVASISSLEPESEYLEQFKLLGIESPVQEFFVLENIPYGITAENLIYVKNNPTLQTLTGYLPGKTLNINNTGTIFEISGNLAFTNYTTTEIITTAYISPLYGAVTSIPVYNTYDALPQIYQDSQASYLSSNITLQGTISGPAYETIEAFTDVTTQTIHFVPPPDVELSIQSTKSLIQDQDLIVAEDITINVNVTGGLSYAWVLETTEGVSVTDVDQEFSGNYTVNALPGTTQTATLCVFPLLSTTTDFNYITGSSRINDTGILPIVLTKTYILNQLDAFIPIDNLAIDFSTSEIQYNNSIIDSTFQTDVSNVSALICKNQYGETIPSVVSLTGYLKDSAQYTVQELKTIINKNDSIYLTIDFDGTQTTEIYNIDTLATTPVILKLAPFDFREITLTARPKNSFSTTVKTAVYQGKYFDFITPSIYFSKFVPAWYASLVNPNPFEVTIWNDSENTIDQIYTYVQNSKSYPYDNNLTRYNRLLPQWSFQDSNQNVSEAFPVQNVNIYNSLDGSYIGTSGTSVFYFQDDTPTGPDGELLVVSPVVTGLFALQDKLDNVIDQPSYANSKQRATLLYYVNNIHPSTLNITRDGVRSLKPYYWYTNPIPNTITLGTNQILNNVNMIDFSYPYSRGDHPFTIGLAGSTLFETISAPNTISNSFTVNYVNTSFDNQDDLGFPTTGFVRTTMSPDLSTGKYRLFASVTVSPSDQYSHTPFMWICDNKNNLITNLFVETGYNKDQYLECKRNSISQRYTTTPVSGVTNIIGTLGLSGVTEATNVAIDGFYNAWITDGGNDIAYKINNYGEILGTINFPQGSTPGGLAVDNEQNVWFTLVDDVSAVKYSTDGDYLQSIIFPVTSSNDLELLYSPAGIDIDINNNVWITFTNSVCSVVNKYTSDGDLLNSITLPPFYSPVDIIASTTQTDLIYVLSELNSQADDYKTGGLHKVRQGTVTTLLSGFSTPTHFNIDANNNIWILIGEYYAISYNVSTETPYVYDLQLLYTDGSCKSIENISTVLINPNIVSGLTAWFTYDSTTADTTSQYTPSAVGIGNAKYTDGVNDLGLFLDKQLRLRYSLPIGNDMSFCAWINIQESGTPIPISFDSVAFSSGPNLFIVLNKVYWNTGDAQNNPFKDQSNTIVDVSGLLNEWHHFAVINNGTIGKTTLYIDGEFAGTANYKTAASTTNNVWVGGWHGGSTIYNFKGAVDDFAIWNRVLTSTEISTVYNSTYSDYFISDVTAVNDKIPKDKTFTKLNGVGGHSDGTIWFINNENNKVLIASLVGENKLALSNTINIYPETPLKSGYYVYPDSWSGYTITQNPCFYEVNNVDWEIGTQAHGDWTGLRRALRLTPINCESYTVSGFSAEFEIKTSPPGIRIINDSYNLSNTLTNIFPQILQAENNPVLHNEFLPGALGTDTDSYNTIGRQFFEKIANFSLNHSDIDFCNVNQLYNIANSMGIVLDDFNLNYPGDLQHALDILSIQFRRLYGEADKYNKRYTRQSITTSEDSIESSNKKRNYDINSPLPENTSLNAGDSIVVEDKILKKYDVIYINTPTQLKNLSGYGLRPVYNFDANSLFPYYSFYYEKNNETPDMINSHIDWNSSLTTITSSLSSLNEWYGQDGILDQIFNYYLNKGLGFIET